MQWRKSDGSPRSFKHLDSSAFDNVLASKTQQKSFLQNNFAASMQVTCQLLLCRFEYSRGDILISLGSLFSRQPAPLLGIDVSSSSAKLVELGRDKAGAWVLERCAIEPLEPGWISDGNIEKFDEVADAVRRLVKKSGSRTKNVALALPSSAVISKRITLPADLSDQEMEVQVESEANQYIPFSLDEVSLDFCVVGPSKNSPGDVDVLIAASRREKVQDREGLAEAAGLKPVVVDVESHAARLAAGRLVEAMPNKGQDAVVALFEVGSMTTSMQIMRNEEVLYERDQGFGGAQLTQHIVRQYGFSLDEAEAKKRNDDLPEDYRSAVLQPFVEGMAQEIGRALQFFFTSTPYNRVDRILIAGGSAALQGLTDAVTSGTGFAATIVNPFEGMEVGGTVRVKKMTREAPGYLTACGLAMRRFLQ